MEGGRLPRRRRAHQRYFPCQVFSRYYMKRFYQNISSLLFEVFHKLFGYVVAFGYLGMGPLIFADSFYFLFGVRHHAVRRWQRAYSGIRLGGDHPGSAQCGPLCAWLRSRNLHEIRSSRSLSGRGSYRYPWIRFWWWGHRNRCWAQHCRWIRRNNHRRSGASDHPACPFRRRFSCKGERIDSLGHDFVPIYGHGCFGIRGRGCE